MLQQGLIWRVQVSPQRKLNFLLICVSILIIILLIKIAWQTFYHAFPWKQLQSPLMFSQMPRQWLLQFKNAAVLSLNNCTAGQKHGVCLISCCMHLQYVCTMHTIDNLWLWYLEGMQMSLWWCAKPITGEIQNHVSSVRHCYRKLIRHVNDSGNRYPTGAADGIITVLIKKVRYVVSK